MPLLVLPKEFEKKRLPKWHVFVWLISDWCRNAKQDGSHLIVSWFSSDITDVSMQMSTSDQVAYLDWELFSEDFCY